MAGPGRGCDAARPMTSIYERIGGSESVAAAVELFYERVLGDPVLRPYFADTDMRGLKTHMRAFLAAVHHVGLGRGQLLEGLEP